MTELAIDIETYSETDIRSGVHKYTEDPAFEILLIAYSYNKGPVKIIDLCRMKREGPDPDKIMEVEKFKAWLIDPSILKTAYNAQFEITCLNKSFGVNSPFGQWSCTMALAAQAGLPFGLDNVAKVIKGEQKQASGKELIRFFSMPCKPTKSNGLRTRNYPEHDFSKWLEYIGYCKQDVVAEQSIRGYLSWFKVSTFEKDMWELDQKINHKGVLIDRTFVENAIKIDNIVHKEVINEFKGLTGLENPNSVSQVKDHIKRVSGTKILSLNREVVQDLKGHLGEEVNQILGLREKLSHAAVKKFTAMLNSVGSDQRIRDLFQYYGANRTGRWASRNVQLQNLKRNDLDDLDFARDLVKDYNLDVLKITYEDVGEVLGNLVRTAFIAPPGSLLYRSDFSAIEARVLSWLADETWRLKVFETHGKIYEASAAMMFKVSIEEVDTEMRRKGKIAELALGYQGSVGAMQKMGGSKMGLSMIDMESIVTRWRGANRKIVRFWYTVQKAAIRALTGSNCSIKYLKFYKRGSNLCIQLPSGRELIYINARYTGDKIIYEGMNQATKQWGLQDSYGGKLVENIVQAIARDLLADAMKRINGKGHSIIMHIHDEVVVESEKDIQQEINDIMSEPIPWAPGLPLKAETLTSKYYQK